MWIHLQNLKGSEILTAKITVLSQKSLNPIAGLTASQEMRSERIMNKIFDTETKGERAVVITMIIGAVIAASILMMLPPVPMV